MVEELKNLEQKIAALLEESGFKLKLGVYQNVGGEKN